MKKISLLVFSLLLASGSYTQAVRQPIAARYVGLGAYSNDHLDAFSFTTNQAALAKMKTPGVGVYGERRFLLSAANMYAVAAVLPTKHGNFGFQGDYFGFKNYNESEMGVAFAKSLGTRFDIGIKFNYYSFRIPGYGNASTVNFEVGTIAHLSEKFHAGIHVYNPVGGKLSNTGNEKLASVYEFGIGYEPSEKFLVSTGIIKVEDQPVNVDVGFQYNFMTQFFVRAGTSTATTNSYIGAGIRWKSLQLDISGGYHPQLGFTPGLSLIINFYKKED